MKQSTTFAQVATNQFDYLSSALRANTPPCKKHSSSRKFLTLSISLRLLLVMLLTLTASTAWAETYTHSFNTTGTVSVSNNSVTLSNVTWSVATTIGKGSPTYTSITKGYSYCGWQFGSSKDKYYSKVILSTNAFSSYNVQSVVLNMRLNGGVSTTMTVKQGSTTIGTATMSTANVWTDLVANSTKGTGGDLSITIATTQAFYIHSITVTYEDAVPSCSIKPTVGTTLQSVTATENSIKATISISSIGGCNIIENGLVYSTTNSTPTVGGSGCTKVTTTACGSTAANKTVTITGLTCGQSYYIRGYATNEAGTSYTNVTTKSTSDCPKYTVTLMDDTDNPLSQTSAGGTVTLPKRDGCTGYTFAGWTKSWSVDQTTWTTTAPTIIPAGSYTPTANESLYPVYTKTEGGGSEPTAYSAGDVGSFIIASNVSDKWYAIPENPTLSSDKITGVEITVSQTAGGVKYVSTANAKGYTWKIANATNGQTISDGSQYIYHSNGGASGTKLTYGASTSYTWKIEKETNGLTFKGMNGSTTNSRGLLFNGSVFGGYALSNEDESGYYRIQVLPIGGGSTTYYISVPECTTKTSVTLNPNGGTISTGDWAQNGTKYTQTVETTNDFTLPTPTKTGYAFGGWYESSTFSGSAVTEIEAGTTGTKEFWAKWTAKQYTVQLDNQGATTVGATSVNATYNAAMPSIADNLPKKTGSTFLGYFTATSGGTKYYNADGTSAKNWDKTSTATLYAQWECVTPTISTQPQSATYLRDDDADALSVVAAASDATLTYQWQKSTDNSTWFDITGATEATYKPSTQSVGTTYYQVVVTNSDGNCSATSDLATITVRSANCKWVETDIANINSGDEVVVTMTKSGYTYAMSNNRGTTIAPEAIDITVKDGIINQVVETYNQWTIIKDNNYLVFYADASNRLYGNSADDGLRVGSTNNAKTNHEFFIAGNYLVNNVTSRYVGVNLTKKEWYSYKTNTGNIVDQTLKFYKKECLPIGQYWINYELTDVVCTDNPVKNKISTDDNAVELNFEATGEHNELPTTIIVTNGSTTLTVNTDYTWNNATGVLTLNPSQITDNITISIAAQKRKYTVTFDANGHGTAPAAQSVTAEGTASEPTAPEATGYTFVGWYTDSECTNVFDFATPITGDITLYAKWTVNKYTITFKNYDGTELQSSEVAYGETPSYTGETPTREQTAQYTYTFKGWSPTIAPATKNQDYIAQFDEVTRSYTVTWMVGTTEYTAGTPTNQVEYDKKVTNLPTSPQDDAIGTCANKFIGWSTKSSGSNAENADYYDDLFTTAENSPAITDATTFYAVFATASSGGGENTAQVFATSSLGNTNSVTTGFTISAEADKKDGYYQDGSGTKRYVQVMKSEVSTPMITVTPTSLTVTAKLGGGTEKNPLTNSVYAILLDADGNELGSAVVLTNKITAKTGSDFTASLPVANATDAYGVRVYHQKETSYNVRYYAISLSYKYNNTTYSNYVTNCCALASATNLTVSGTTANSATLTWTAPSSTTGITKLQVRNAETDEVVVDDIAINATTATITELTECTSYQYYVVSVGEDCEVVSNIVTAQPFGSAKTVNYNYNGGSGSVAAFTTNCTNQTITLPAATRTGYDFNGWYTDATGGTRVGGANDTYEPATSPVTLYAQWTIQSYTVTWNPDGGKWGESTDKIVHTYNFGDPVNSPADPTRDGYRFTGWNGTVASTMPATNITYTAQWKQNYTITFHDGDDTTPWTQTIDAELIDLNTYVGTHACGEYTFAGWSTDATQYNDQTANITTWVTGTYTPTANIHLYAVYVKGDLATDFTPNCDGGVYEIWEKGTNQHMAGRQNGGGDMFYTTEWYNGDCTSCEGTDGAPFTITKVADNTYTLQNADGQYITRDSYDGNADELEIKDTWENADRYKWIISEGTNGSWRFTNKAATTYALVFYDKYFQLRIATNVTNGSSYYDLELTPAQTNVYQSNPNCGPYYIIFNTHGGEFIQGEYAYGEEQTGLTETTYSKFPAAELEGYTFAGWKDGSPIDDEITADNASDAPYLKQAGEDLVVSSNKTYHAVYYYYDEEEDIDFSKEFTTSIYAEVNGMKYFLAGTPSSGTMSSTTDCGYVSEVTITPGTGANAGKYKITVNGVAMAPEANETDLVNGTYWWTITERSVGSGEYKISGQDKKNIVLFNSSWGHYSYNQGSEYGNNYYYPRFGKCLQHHWTSNPTLKPSLNLSGDVYVTATNARGIMATSTLKVSAKQLNANEKVNITSNSNDVYFSADYTVNFVKANKPTNTLTITASPSGVIEQDIYVHYKPSTEGNGTPASVVVSANLATPNPSVTDDQTIHVRNLPAKFVIATKVGATWYALPADMSSATNPLGVVIEVDETTMTTIAPNTTTYTLWPVKTTATENDRYTNVTGVAYGDRVRFAAVNYEQRGLWANNNKDDNTIRNYAVIDALGDDGIEAYEWKVTTTIANGHWQYTLQTDQPNNQKYLRYWTAASGGAKWGTYASGNDKLYFLPVTETKPFDYKVVEWYPTKVLIQTEAAITNPIVKIGGVLVDNVTCTNKGGKLYEISGLPLVNNPTKVLTLSYTADEVTYTNSKVVPIILSRETMTISAGELFASLTKEVYNYADLVVRDGATLTMDGTQDANTLWDVTIYPTSKIYVPESQKLTVHSLTLFGGIDEIYNGSTYTLNKYGVPELSLKGNLKKSISTIDYLIRVNLDQMYSLAVPYDVQLADIKYWDGSDIALGTALYVSAYDGEARANQSKKTWIYETDFESRLGAATLKAGVGYTISAELQNGVGSKYSILRMPMTSNVENDATEAAKTVAVTAWGKDANVTDNHKGWNLVGNPYMTSIQGADDDDLVLGYLKETGTGPWEWVEKTYRYVTIPADNGKDYSQLKFTDAVLPPFKNFFVQIGTSGDLVFGLSTRQSMPARSTQAAIEKEVEFEILMSNDARQDNTGLLISKEYSPAYEINADLEKMIGSMSVYTIYGGYKLAYNALSPINASEWIPMGYIAPAAGEYTFRLDDVEKIVEQVEHVYVIDYDANNIVDLMTDEYKFTTNKEQNDNRFAINVVLSQDKDNTTTGLDIIQGNNTAPIKFIYHDKMYIQSGGVIYDATGKQVTNINK